MRNVVVGSFIGFVLAAAFLAACGSGGDDASPPRATAPQAVTWTPPGTTFTVASGFQVGSNEVWTSNNVYNNAADGTRNQYAAFEIAGNIESHSSGTVTFDLGILPTINGANYATEPWWLGTVSMAIAGNRRVTLALTRLPPLAFKFALRMRTTATATGRLSSLTLTPYDEELP